MRFNLFHVLFAAIGLLLLVLIAWPAEPDPHGDPDAYGHAADGHYLDFEPFGKVELPRIFLFRDGEGDVHLDVYGSTRDMLLDEERPYLIEDADENILSRSEVLALMSYSEEEFVELAGEEAAGDLESVQGIIGLKDPVYFPVAVPAGAGAILIDFSITRQIFAMFIAAAILLIVGLRLAARYRSGAGREEAPRGVFQNMMEVVFVFVRDQIVKVAIGDQYRKYLPYLMTVFLFILFGNLLGLVPWGVTATSNIMVTGTLAAFTLVITLFSGTKDYWRHMINPPDVPAFVKPLLAPVEFIGLFTKHFALAFRLFGNMLSGHLVIVSVLGVIFIFTAQWGAGIGAATIPISLGITLFIFLLKLLISLIQAYVFTILSAIFIGLALEEHEHEEHHEEPSDQADDYMHGDGVAEDLGTTEGKHAPLATPAG